jgi:hypothetical protein
LPELTNAVPSERSDIVSDETKATEEVDEPQLAADEVKEEELEDVSGGYGEGSGGASMQITASGGVASSSSINYP